MGGLESDEEKDLKQFVVSKHSIDSEHEYMSWCTRIEFERDGIINWPQQHKMAMTDTHSMYWKFGGFFFMDGHFGSSIKIGQYFFRLMYRHSTNWGWVLRTDLHGTWLVLTSFPMPPDDNTLHKFEMDPGLGIGGEIARDDPSFQEVLKDDGVDLELLKARQLECKQKS